MMKQKFYSIILTIFFINLIFSGCESDYSDDIEVSLSEHTVLSDEVTNNEMKCDNVTNDSPNEDEAGLSNNRESDNDSIQDKGGESVFVYICGAVKNPGVYSVSADTRLYTVVSMAGGFKTNAYEGNLNLAEQVCDGQKIYVLTNKQYRQQTSELNRTSDNQEIKSEESYTVNNDTGVSDKININTATAEQLTVLPGIGVAKAAMIVAYRDENGNFSAIEDIKNVSGIGEATFANIKLQITVR